MRFAPLLLLCCAGLPGQPLPRTARELELTKSVDAGATTIHLLNAYTAPATAWIVECHGETTPGERWTSKWHWDDQELGLEPKPLEPGKETGFRIPPQLGLGMAQLSAPGKCDDFHVVAAVFADGSVSGDFTWINAIVSERRMVYQDIAKAAEILNKAVADGTALSDVAKQLEEWQNRELPIVQRGKPSANYGLTNGARSQPMTTGQPAPDPTPPTRPFPHAAVPGATLWLLEDQKTSLTEAIAILSGWQKRLGLMKPVAEAGETPAPLTRLLNGPLPLTQPAPDLRGKPAPDFTLKDVDGTPLALKDLRGKTVFVDFWATWCKPCIAEMPQIKALYDEFKDRGLVVIAIDLREPAGKARKYFEENGYPFRNLLDPGRVAFQAYGGGGIPKVALIDKDGIVRFFQQGYNSRQDFRAEVMKLGLK